MNVGNCGDGGFTLTSTDKPTEIFPPPVMSMAVLIVIVTLYFISGIEFDELAKVTNSFNESNVIGMGGFGKVYLGRNFRSYGTSVAIKVLTEAK